MDVQRGIVGSSATAGPGYLPRLGRRSTTPARAGVPVIYVVIGFRPGHPEISPRNRTSRRSRRRAGSSRATRRPRSTPTWRRPGDLVVTKRRVTAFTGSDLDVVLRGRGAATWS